MKKLTKVNHLFLYWLFLMIVAALLLFSRCGGGGTILESTHKKNIKGEWIPDSTKTEWGQTGD